LKLKVKSSENAVVHNSKYGPTFCGGHDLKFAVYRIQIEKATWNIIHMDSQVEKKVGKILWEVLITDSKLLKYKCSA